MYKGREHSKLYEDHSCALFILLQDLCRLWPFLTTCKLMKIFKNPSKIPHSNTKTLRNSTETLMLWFGIKYFWHFEDFFKNHIFLQLDGEHFCSGDCLETPLLSIYIRKPYILRMPQVSSLWLSSFKNFCHCNEHNWAHWIHSSLGIPVGPNLWYSNTV